MLRSLLPFLPLLLFLLSCQYVSKDLPGRGAEDLWGERVRLNHEINSGKPVVIVPFSTSNCGYCMIDGFYTENNYIKNNEQFGGGSYHMCLFNPQLDIYAFQKHFGWHGTVLTYPPALHELHQNGFPAVLAFRDGEQVMQDFYSYAKFDSLNELLWDGLQAMHPAGELHIATRLIYENEMYDAVCIVPDTTKIPDDEHEFARKWKAYTFTAFDAISDEDKQKHLFIRSGSDIDALKQFFEGEEIPLIFDSGRFRIGDYNFNPDTVAFYGCFPNPFNWKKYVVMTIFNDHAKLFGPANYLDYIVFTGDQPGEGIRLLYGHFDKEDQDVWSFSSEKAFGEMDLEVFCDKKCPIPVKRIPEMLPVQKVKTSHSESESIQKWTFGNKSCRFPDIAIDSKGNCWAVWEEEGNILLGLIDGVGVTQTWYPEHNASDSYNPKIAADGDDIWIFYLNDQEGYYRLYARAFDGKRFTDEILLTEKQPYDVVTPEVVSGKDGSLIVMWCEWLANQRFLRYRTLKNGIPDTIRDILEAPPLYTKGYTNAWWPSLVYTEKGEVWGAWNQHYPATCGVYGGSLSDTAITITQPSEAMEDRENGGYPDIFTDGSDIFVVWESNGWNVYWNEQPQKIKIARFEMETGHWTPGKVISLDTEPAFNRTPSGACDSKGNKYVAWSGREIKAGDPWGIWLAKEVNGKWNDPVLISDPGKDARYPKIVIDPDDHPWISWHSGTGKSMKAKVTRLPTQ